MKPFLRWWYVVIALMLAGCSNYYLRKDEVLAIPLQPTLQQEMLLARMELILARRALTGDERAQLLYERGVLYDSIGLRALARNDFSQALAIRPNIPQVFNYLGIYLMQASNVDVAYEAFDSVLELDPIYNYARLNRGIASYYGGRFSLAKDYLLAFYQDDPNDPFRSLQLYLVEREMDPKKADVALKQRYDKANLGQWGWNIVEFYLGNISEKTLMSRLKVDTTDNTSLAEHLSETDFYLGKHHLSLGDKNTASALFKLTVANTLSTAMHCWNWRF